VQIIVPNILEYLCEEGLMEHLDLIEQDGASVVRRIGHAVNV
jgi:hypothetical protein